MVLPGDFKTLVDVYGAGSFFDGLDLPGSRELVALVDDFVETRRVLRAEGVPMLEDEPVFPDPGCLVPWASSDGYLLMWRTGGPPVTWPVFGGEGAPEDAWAGSATEAALLYASGGTEFFRSLAPEADPPDTWHDGQSIRNWFAPAWRRGVQRQVVFSRAALPFVDWVRAAEGLFDEVVPRSFRDFPDRDYGSGHFEAEGCRVTVTRRDESVELTIGAASDDTGRLDQLIEAYERRVGQQPRSISTLEWDRSLDD